MIEQTLKQTLNQGRSKMIRITPDRIIQLIEEKFEGTPFEIFNKIKDENNVHILQNPMMIISVEKGRIVKVSFHVAVRSDVAYQIIMRLKDIEEIKILNIATVFYYNVKESKMYYGNEAEHKLLTDLRFTIINDFMNEQTQLMMLKNMKTPYVS
jgi:hypothetical protein